MSSRSNACLRSYPVRNRIGAESLRPVNIRVLLPNVTVQNVAVVARMTARFEHADANLFTGHSREHRCDWIASDDVVRQDLRVIKLAGLFEWSIRWITHALPQWFGAVINRLLSRVFRILGFSEIWYGDA